MVGNDAVADGLGVGALLLAIVAIGTAWRQKVLPYTPASSLFSDGEHVSPRVRLIGRLGAGIALLSFVWLAAIVCLFGASEQRMPYFYAWVGLFLLGTVLLFVPSVVRLVRAIGRFGSRDDG